MKKKFIAIIAVVIIVASLTACFVGCGATNLKGLDIDLAKAVAAELGLEVKFQKISWDTKEVELNAGNIDMIWNGLTISDDRKVSMAISEPYLKNNQVCVINRKNKDVLTTKESLVGKKFSAEKASAGVAAINKNFPGVKLVETEDQMSNFIELISGTSDVAVIDSTMANYYCNDANSDYGKNCMVIPNIVLSSEEYGIALRKNDLGTLDKLNVALASMYASGKTKLIADKYQLGSEVVAVEYTSKYDRLTSLEKEGWESILKKGKFTIGYTVYAPIAFK
ncbi:MAG: transporter substrate-binding domain-containing protein [Clostridia bacterium]